MGKGDTKGMHVRGIWTQKDGSAKHTTQNLASAGSVDYKQTNNTIQRPFIKRQPENKQVL